MEGGTQSVGEKERIGKISRRGAEHLLAFEGD